MKHEIIMDPDYPMNCICKWCGSDVMEIVHEHQNLETPCIGWAGVPHISRRRIRRRREMPKTTWKTFLKGLLPLVAALFIMTGTAADASYINTWSGPGAHACNNADADCSMEWAMTQLTDDERAQLADAMKYQPTEAVIMVNDGDVFNMMSYYKDGAPVAYRTTTVAALPSAEVARGWQMDGWAFVKMDACQNWSIISTGQSVGPVVSSGASASNVSTAGFTSVTGTTGTGITWDTPFVTPTVTPIIFVPTDDPTDDPVVDPGEDPVVELVVTPLPAGFVLVLTFVLLLVGLARLGRRNKITN